MIEKSITLFKTKKDKARFLCYSLMTKRKINWNRVLDENKGILFQEFSFNEFNTRRRIKEENLTLPLRQISNRKDILAIFNYYIKRKDYKTIKKIIIERPWLLNDISLSQWKIILPNCFYKVISWEHFVPLKISFIRELLKYEIELKIGQEGFSSERSEKKLSLYIKKGGRINKSIIYNVLNSRKSDYVEENLFFIRKRADYKKSIKQIVVSGDYKKYLMRLDWSIKNNKRNSEVWKTHCDIIDKLGRQLIRKKYRVVDITDFDDIILDKELEFNNFFKNRAVIRELTKNSIKGTYFYPHSFRVLYFCKKYYPEMDEQLLLPLIRNYYKEYDSSEHYRFYDKELDSFFKVVSNIVKPRVAIKWFLKNNKFSSRDLRDTSEMYDRLMRLKEGNVLMPKFKTIKELHDWLSLEVSKLKQKKFNLGQGLDDMDGLELGSGIKVVVPKTNHDLIAVGKELKHCVGNGGYADRALMDKIKILTLFKDDVLWSCLEYNNGKFIQKRGLRNQNTKLTSQQEELLLKEIDKCLNQSKVA